MATKKQLERLKAIEACADKRGRIAPRTVWQAAKADKKHPLHNDFDWDVKRAAEAHWDDQASRIIREVKLTIIQEDVKIATPYFVSDPSSKGSAYIPTTMAARREELSEAILLDEVRRIEAAVIRARALADKFELTPHFNRMLDEIVEVKARMDRRRGDNPDNRPHM